MTAQSLEQMLNVEAERIEAEASPELRLMGVSEGTNPKNLDGWTDSPAPIEAVPEPPEFPLSTIPEPHRSFLESITVSAEVPSALPGMVWLAAAGSCVAGQWCVEVKPGLIEGLNLYACVGLPSGSRKSSVFRRILQPIRDYEAEMRIRMEPDIARAKSELEIKRRSLNAEQGLAAEGDTEASDRAARLQYEVDQLGGQLSPPQLICDDATPEALVSAMARNGGRTFIASSECDLFGIFAGRYTKQGGANLSPYLKGHDGETIIVNRKTREERIENPVLSVCVSAQPGALKSLLSDPVFLDRGLCSRFLYAVPKSTLGYRTNDTPPIPERVVEEYEVAIRSVLTERERLEATRNTGDVPSETPARIHEPTLIGLSSDARKILQAFREVSELWMRESDGRFGQQSALSGFCSKLPHACARIAAILELMEDRSATRVGVGAMSNAVQIVEEFIAPHALAAFDVAGLDEDADIARTIVRRLGYRRCSEVSKRDLYLWLKGGRSSVKRVAQLDDPIEMLTEYGYLSPIADDLESGPGRMRSPRYAVHPTIWQEGGQTR